MSILRRAMEGLQACGYHEFLARLTELDDSGDLDAAVGFAHECLAMLRITEQECEWCGFHHPAPMHCAYCSGDLIAEPGDVREVLLQDGYCPCCERDEIEHHALLRYLLDGGA